MKYILVIVVVIIVIVVVMLQRSKTTKQPSWVSMVPTPIGWNLLPDPDDTNVLYYENGDGVASISVSLEPQFLNISTQDTKERYSPKDLIDIRFKSIQDEISQNPKLNWQNFMVAESPRNYTQDGFTVAEGAFMVDENILGKGTKVPRTIKRAIVYTHDDILDIVFAATNTTSYSVQNVQFESFLHMLLISLSETTKFSK
jgi:hypothetical protein